MLAAIVIDITITCLSSFNATHLPEKSIPVPVHSDLGQVISSQGLRLIGNHLGNGDRNTQVVVVA